LGVERDAVPIVICDSVRFFSQGYEDAFFAWIARIRCVSHVEGVGTEIRLHIPRRAVSWACLRELIGLFWRYEINMGQLVQFETSANTQVFRRVARVKDLPRRKP
jgi:hypothetical protein